MILSLGSVLMCIIISIVLMLYVSILIYKHSVLFHNGIRVTFIGIIFLFIRMLLPFNFPFSVTVPVERILPTITQFLYNTKLHDFSIFYFLVAVWWIVGSIKLIRLAWINIKFHASLNSLVKIDHAKKDRIRKILDQNGGEAVQIAVVPKTVPPGLTGLHKPILLIPDYTFSDTELQYIISHEIKHYQHHDLVLKLLLDVSVCIYWWNPIIYYLRRKFSLSVEISNDFEVVKNLNEAAVLEYLNCLVLGSKLCSGAKSVAEGTNSIFYISGQTDLKYRVSMLLKEIPKKQTYYNLKIINYCALFCILMVSIFIIPEAYSIRDTVKQNTFSIDADHSYFIHTQNGYNLYIDDKYIITVTSIDETLQDIPVYEEEYR